MKKKSNSKSKNNKHKLCHKVFKAILVVLGVIITLNGIAVATFSSAILTIVSTLIAGLFFLSCGVFYEFLLRKVPLIIKILIVLCVAFVIGVVSFLYIYGTYDNVDYEEDAVIVLGAAVKGEKLSLTLKNRLDSALKYRVQNPDVVIVVSGGRGLAEDICEAEAMSRYLIEKGVPESKIIKEDKSTSTEQNFKFSKELLDKHFKDDYRLAYVTNDFHVYRAGEIAESVGISNTTHCHSTAPAVTFLPNGFREFLAVMYMWVFG